MLSEKKTRDMSRLDSFEKMLADLQKQADFEKMEMDRLDKLVDELAKGKSMEKILRVDKG